MRVRERDTPRDGTTHPEVRGDRRSRVPLICLIGCQLSDPAFADRPALRLYL